MNPLVEKVVYSVRPRFDDLPEEIRAVVEGAFASDILSAEDPALRTEAWMWALDYIYQFRRVAWVRQAEQVDTIEFRLRRLAQGWEDLKRERRQGRVA